MTYQQALTYRRPWWRKVGRVVIDVCHVLILAAVITVPGALIDIYRM